jgi:hypothetical protein
LGTIGATGKIISNTTQTTIIILGHGYPVSNRAELVEYHDMLVTVYEKVSKLKKNGMSMNETIAAKPTAAYDAK